ncbi:MAG: hypothetical protein JXA37_05790 [Chloroflexia bacterium]|nr:hypothetical protein [Chloroflexia bacterium]
MLIIAVVALTLALLLPDLLAGAAPSTGQLFIFFLIGALAGYIAECIRPGPRPLGYGGSILAAMVGAWVGSNVLPRLPPWDFSISTSRGNVAVLTSLGLALFIALAWRAGIGFEPLSRRIREAWEGLLSRTAQGKLPHGFLFGLICGASIGWGGSLLLIQHRRSAQPASSPLLILALTAALSYGGGHLLYHHGFQIGGKGLEWWLPAVLGFVLAAGALCSAALLLT